MLELDKVYNEECLSGLKRLPDNSVDCCVTSPPYYALRDYGVDGQIGLEETPEEYVRKLTDVFMEVYRVLKPEGTLWLNIGDSYNGSGGNHKETHKNDTGFQGNIGVKYGGKGAKVAYLKPKDLIGIPWTLAFSLRNADWYLRQDIIWDKSGCCMPESVTDRCTKSHEYIFLMSKSQKYYFDYEAIQVKSKYTGDNRGERHDSRRGTKMNSVSGITGEYRNKRDVWHVNTKPDNVAHFATYPEELIKPCILAGCPSGGVVLDPFMGSGTTARVARKLNRHFVGFELNPEYCKIIEKKIQVTGDLFY